MNGVPALNLQNVKLVALWLLVIIFILTFWHFALRQL